MNSDDPKQSNLVGQVNSEKSVVAGSIGIVAGSIGTVNLGDDKPIPIPDQLPPDLPFFAGRLSEIAELKQVLLKEKSVVALCSLWGMGGIGKSALGVYVVKQLQKAGHFQDGILWADFGSTSVDDVLVGFIRSFGYGEDQVPHLETEKVKLLRSIIKSKKVLLFLDNVSSEEQAIPFLLNEPTISIVITSRKQLLGLTDYSAYIKDLDVFSPKEALELLSERVGARCEAEPIIAGRICELTGYLPLAIAIAASRLFNQERWPFLKTFCDRLEDEYRRLDEFKDGTRERDLRAVFATSYNFLSDPQKKIVSFLSLFGKANFGSSALVALMGMDKQNAIDELEEFVSLSLLLRSSLGGYHFHDLLLLFSSEKLASFSEAEINVAKSKLENYTDLLKQANMLGSQASVYAKTGDLVTAIEYIQQAQLLNQETGNRAGRAHDLGGLASAYARQGRLDEAIKYYEEGLILCKEIGNRAGQASTLGGLASAYARQGQLDKAIKYYQQAQLLNQEIGDRAGQASTLGGLASAYAQQDQLDKAIKYYQEDLVLCKEIDDRAGQASALGGLASAYVRQGWLDEAIVYYQQVQLLNQETGNRAGQASTLGGLASAYAQQGRLDKAIECYQAGLILCKEIGNRAGQASTLGGLASAYVRQGWLDKAIEYYQEGLILCKEIGNRAGQASTLGGLASAYAQHGWLDKAIECYQEGLVLCKETGNRAGQAHDLGGLASAYGRKGEPEKAIEYYLKAQEINEENCNIKGQARALGGIALIYYYRSEWANAIIYLEKALKLNREMKDRFMIKTLYKLAVAYKSTGDLQKAREYIQEAYQLSQHKDRAIDRLFEELTQI
jgi:tetratricopeptide (TPR) repeat protein